MNISINVNFRCRRHIVHMAKQKDGNSVRPVKYPFISKILSMKYDTILRFILNKTVNHYIIKEAEDT